MRIVERSMIERSMKCLFLVAAVALSGCVSTALVIVDRKTALEEQASGKLTPLADGLADEGLAPRAAPVTHGQLDEAGVDTASPGTSNDPLAGEEPTDLELIDDLLVAGCVGEGKDGLLVDTHADCSDPGDLARLGRAVEKSNRGRWQVWRWLAAERPKKSMAEVRAAWREAYLTSVVCGAKVQKSDGTWENKSC